MDLWNFTYVQSGDDLRKLSFNRDGEVIFLDAKENQIQLKCYSGEPQLEKLMDNGKEYFRLNRDLKIILVFKKCTKKKSN